MFGELKRYDVIIVTGPQRSGTRIAANMIAYDTGHELIDERQIAVDSLYRLAAAKAREGVVIQCPALCGFIHNFADPDTLICMMMRPISEIIASQKRIDWKFEPLEQIYFQNFDTPIAEQKYNQWNWQKTIIKNYLEIDYHSLDIHPLWKPKEERKNFGDTQIA